MLVVFLITAVSCQVKHSENQNNDESMTKDSLVVKMDTALIFQAALDGNYIVIEKALKDGFKANTMDENKRTLLMLASYNGHEDIVKKLLDSGADVNLTDNMDRTTLMFASSGPFVGAVSMLLKAGADVNKTEKEQNWTAAMMAATEGQLEVLKVLVSFGADLKKIDSDGDTALKFAEAKGYTEMVDFIKSQLAK